MEDLFNIPTYLSIIQKHPELRDEILELRRIKNRGTKALLILAGIFAFLAGYFIALLTLVI